MNTISFKNIIIEIPDEHKYTCADIYIDDRLLLKYVKEIEYSQSYTKNEKLNAGSYVSISNTYLHKSLTNFDKEKDEDNKISLMCCSCYCNGCWDLVVEVIETKNTVLWKNFGNDQTDYNYSELNFEFDKEQYYNAIKNLIQD